MNNYIVHYLQKCFTKTQKDNTMDYYQRGRKAAKEMFSQGYKEEIIVAGKNLLSTKNINYNFYKGITHFLGRNGIEKNKALKTKKYVLVRVTDTELKDYKNKEANVDTHGQTALFVFDDKEYRTAKIIDSFVEGNKKIIRTKDGEYVFKIK